MKRTITLAGGRFAVETQVTGKGAPLLFLHGVLGPTERDLFLDELGRNFEVFAPALPGYGASTGGELLDDVVDAALFYHLLMDELDIPSAYIVGYCLGGMLAAEVAALDVHRARKLVLANSFGLWLDDHPTADFYTASPAELTRLLFFDPQAAPVQPLAETSEDFRVAGEAELERVKRLAMSTKFLWPLPERGFARRAYRVNVPTLLLWGEHDKVVPPVYADAFGKLLKNSRQAIIPQAGHMLVYEKPAEFVQTVTRFLHG